MNLHKESKENGINEEIKKFNEFDEAKVENLIFVLNLLKILLRILLLIIILKKNIKKVIYLILNLMMLEFQVIIIKLLKFELFKFMQKFYMKLEKNLQIL